MRRRVKDADREHGFQDEIGEGGWSPERRRLAEQVSMLTKVLRSPEEGVPELAVVFLTMLGPRVVPYLTSALEDALDESDVRQVSRQSTGSIEREIAGICNALGVIRDSDTIVDLGAALPRNEAVEALAKIGGERALDLVMEVFEDKGSALGAAATHGGRSTPASAELDPGFVRRVFLRFGDSGRRRLKEDLANETGSRRAAVEEIIRILGEPDDR